MCEWFNMAEKDSIESFNREQRGFGLLFKPQQLIAVTQVGVQTSHNFTDFLEFCDVLWFLMATHRHDNIIVFLRIVICVYSNGLLYIAMFFSCISGTLQFI